MHSMEMLGWKSDTKAMGSPACGAPSEPCVGKTAVACSAAEADMVATDQVGKGWPRRAGGARASRGPRWDVVVTVEDQAGGKAVVKMRVRSRVSWGFRGG